MGASPEVLVEHPAEAPLGLVAEALPHPGILSPQRPRRTRVDAALRDPQPGGDEIARAAPPPALTVNVKRVRPRHQLRQTQSRTIGFEGARRASTARSAGFPRIRRTSEPSARRMEKRSRARSRHGLWLRSLTRTTPTMPPVAPFRPILIP